MKSEVLMLVVMLTVQDGEIRESWRIEDVVPAPVCHMMDQTLSVSGKHGVITITCSDLKTTEPKK